MSVFTSLKEYVKNLDERDFYKHLMITMCILILALGGLLYWHSSSYDFYRKKLKSVNAQRAITRDIIAKHELVKQQQTEVDALLAKNPTFKIKEYFDGVVAELGLTRNNTKPSEVSDPQDLNNGYSEVKLDASFTDINTKQLCDLLYKIEQNERVYTKEVVITKALKAPAIDVTLIIATLQPSTTRV